PRAPVGAFCRRTWLTTTRIGGSTLAPGEAHEQLARLALECQRVRLVEARVELVVDLGVLGERDSVGDPARAERGRLAEARRVGQAGVAQPDLHAAMGGRLG